MVEELKVYKNSYGDIFESKEESERQEELTKVKLQLTELESLLFDAVSSMEDNFLYDCGSIKVTDLLHSSPYLIKDNENYQQTERIITLIEKIIDLGRLIKRLESK